MVIRHDRLDSESLVDPRQWPGITTFFGGEGAACLIAPTWLLTAAHVAAQLPTTGNFSIDLAGTRCPLAQVILHPAYVPQWETAGTENKEQEHHEIVDLALVELGSPLTHIPPFDLYEGFDEQGQEVLLLGCGGFGDGVAGQCGFDGALRQATNQIDEVDAYWLKVRFDAPPAGTSLEGVCGRGDSGGPALIHHEGQLLLAGVASWQKTGYRPRSTYGCIDHFARISSFLDWISFTCGLAKRAR